MEEFVRNVASVDTGKKNNWPRLNVLKSRARMKPSGQFLASPGWNIQILRSFRHSALTDRLVL
jgi:hypothetical protein